MIILLITCSLQIRFLIFVHSFFRLVTMWGAFTFNEVFILSNRKVTKNIPNA